jgi:hypothetical protein
MTWLELDFMGGLYENIVDMGLIFLGMFFYDFKNETLSKNRAFLTALFVVSIPDLLLLIIPYPSWGITFAEGLVN